MRKHLTITIVLFISLFFPQNIAAENFKPLQDARELSNQASDEGKAFILYIAAETCSFCIALDEEVMQALLHSDVYRQKVIVRRLLMEDYFTLTDFDTNPIAADLFIQRYEIRATPTLLFLDKQGNELTSRLEGYRKDTFYWTYLDRAINASQKYYKNGSKK